MMDDGVHAIDTLRWMCGGEVVKVSSQCKRIGTPDINFISALLEFDNGATGVMLNKLDQWPPHLQSGDARAWYLCGGRA